MFGNHCATDFENFLTNSRFVIYSRQVNVTQCTFLPDRSYLKIKLRFLNALILLCINMAIIAYSH